MSEQVEDRSPFEGRLIESAKEGDHTAYAELVRAHQEVARRLAYLILQRRDDVDDAVQDAFVKAYQAIGGFRSGADFRPWILRIVRNEALNRRRGRIRRERLALRAANAAGDAAPSPEVMVERQDERRRVLNAVEELPEALRRVIECRFLLGLSEAATADFLRIPSGTVKSRTSRAMDRLRGVLGESEP
ncbi:RNA polymerase sigma factor SigM [soil metagenome]